MHCRMPRHEFALQKLMIVSLAFTILAQGLATAESQAQLRLSIAPVSSEILASQPVRLPVELRVEGGSFTGDFTLDPSAGRLLFVLTSAGTGRRAVSARDLHGFAPADWIPMSSGAGFAPGYVRAVDALALCDFERAQFIFCTAGEYKIQAVTQVFEGQDLESYKVVTLESNVLSIKVREPTGAEADAARLWKGQKPEPGPRLDTAAMQKIVTSYPGTSYAQYARFYLSGDDRVPATERLALTEDLVARKPPAQIEDLALLRLARLVYDRKDLSRSESLAKRVLSLPHASREAKQEASQLLDQIERRPKHCSLS